MWGRTKEKTDGRMQLPGWSCKGNGAQVSPGVLTCTVLDRANTRRETFDATFRTLRPHLRQDSVDGVAALREHQVFVEHEVEGEGLAEGVGADAGLLRSVLLEAVQVLVEGLLLRVLLLDQELDVVALLALGLDHLRRIEATVVLLQSLQACCCFFFLLCMNAFQRINFWLRGRKQRLA